MTCPLTKLHPALAAATSSRFSRVPFTVWFLVGLSASLVVWTIGSALFKPRNPVLSWPSRTLSEWLFPVYGPIECDIVFPVGKTGAMEPLVATGNRKAADLLYLWYESANTVRIGLVSISMKGPLSEPIKITYGQPHHLRISMGSLVPPGRHASVAKLSEDEIEDLRRTLVVEIDGKAVFDIPARFTPTKSSEVLVGATKHLRAYAPTDFTGKISGVTRSVFTPLPADSLAESYGPVRLRVEFKNNPDGAGQPLLVTGITGAGDFIYAICGEDGQLVLGYDHWNGPGFKSQPLTVDFSVAHDLEITLGSLYPPREHNYWSGHPGADVDRLKKLVQVKLDGQVVLEKEQESYPSLPRDVYIGRNIIGGSTCLYEFAGVIKATERLAPPRPGVP